MRQVWSVLVLAVATSACGFNEVIERDQDVVASWAEVENQYKRRADLVPNLVNVVKGVSEFEKSTLQAVVEARAKVGSMQIDASTIEDPAKLREFEQAQNQLGGALSRLLVVAEQYPVLKATESYRDLQAQLEGTENRITVARGRFITAVAEYNKVVLRFPSMIGAKLRSKDVRPTFSGNPANEAPPEVKL